MRELVIGLLVIGVIVALLVVLGADLAEAMSCMIRNFSDGNFPRTVQLCF